MARSTCEKSELQKEEMDEVKNNSTKILSFHIKRIHSIHSIVSQKKKKKIEKAT